MATRRWGSTFAVVAVLASVLAVGAVAVSATPFKDVGISCGVPLTAALHGKVVAEITEGSTSRLRVLTKAERQFYSSNPLAGVLKLPTEQAHANGPFVVCRQPARGRVLFSIAALGLAALALAFVTRRSGTIDLQEPTPTAV